SAPLAPRSTHFPCPTLFRSRTVPHLAVNPDVAARLFDEAVHHGKSEAGTLAFRLGGEKRLEYLFENVLGNAAAGVRHGEHHILRSEEHTSELQSRENLVCRL